MQIHRCRLRVRPVHLAARAVGEQCSVPVSCAAPWGEVAALKGVLAAAGMAVPPAELKV